MRSINIIILAAVTFAISCMAACSTKDYEHCNGTLIPKVTADSQVIAGGSLNLSVTGIDNVYMYNWRGPNQFSSHEQSPVVDNVSSASAGRYTVDVITKTGCIYTAKTDSVLVGSAQAPCSVPNNYAAFSSTYNISFYYVGGSVSGGSYFVSGNGSGGDVDMEFSGTSRPITGVYNIQPLGGVWGPGYVRVNLTNSSMYWSAASGKVYVNATSGKLIISFCQIDFSAGSYKSKVNLQVTVP